MVRPRVLNTIALLSLSQCELCPFLRQGITRGPVTYVGWTTLSSNIATNIQGFNSVRLFFI